MLELIGVFLVVEGVLDVEQSLVVLEEAEEDLVLGVLDGVISDIERLQVLILCLGEGTSDYSQVACIDLAVPQN